MKLVRPSLPRSSYVTSSFFLYFSVCFGSLFVSILCTCCSHFFWYCFISFTMFCAPVFCLIHRFFSLSSVVIPSKCLKNFISAASKRCSSVFFSTQASLPNFQEVQGSTEDNIDIMPSKMAAGAIIYAFCFHLNSDHLFS